MRPQQQGIPACFAAHPNHRSTDCPLPSSPPSPRPQAQWLVQAPALPECPAPVPSPAPAPEQPAITAARCASQQTAAAPAPNTKSPPASPLAALRRGLRRLVGGLRRRLAAAACMARPATLECGGCPGRRLGNASSGAAAEWTVTHVNWS